MESRWDPLSLIVDLVNQVADTPDQADARVEVVIEILRAALDARVGLMIRADLTHLDVRLIGRALTPPIAAGLRHDLRMIRLSDPLLDPVAAGDLHPTTAARAYGELPWRNSRPRGRLRPDLWMRPGRLAADHRRVALRAVHVRTVGGRLHRCGPPPAGGGAAGGRRPGTVATRRWCTRRSRPPVPPGDPHRP